MKWLSMNGRNNMKTFYITKWLLTTGAVAVTLNEEKLCELEERGHVLVNVKGKPFLTCIYKKDLVSKDEVQDKFEEMKSKKLKALERQITKLSLSEIKFVD